MKYADGGKGPPDPNQVMSTMTQQMLAAGGPPLPPAPPPGAQYPTVLPSTPPPPASTLPSTPPPPGTVVGNTPPMPPTVVGNSGTPSTVGQPSFSGGAGVAKAGPADYRGVQQFADQAYQQARRNIDPIQEQQGRRMEQDLVNKGIDPSSAQGKAMLDQQNRNFADQDSAASFGALKFGQDIQNQMFGQSMQNVLNQSDMTKAAWNRDVAVRGQDVQRDVAMASNALQRDLGVAGLDVQRELGLGNQNLQRDLGRAGIDVQRELGIGGQNLQRDLGVGGLNVQRELGLGSQNLQRDLGMGGLNLQQQQQDWAQMMGLEGIDFRNRAYNDKQDQYYDQLTMAMMGMLPIPGYSGWDPSQLAQQQIASSGGGGFFG